MIYTLLQHALRGNVPQDGLETAFGAECGEPSDCWRQKIQQCGATAPEPALAPNLCLGPIQGFGFDL